MAVGKNELSVLSKNSLEYRKNYKHVHIMCMKCYTLENLELAITAKKYRKVTYTDKVCFGFFQNNNM